MAAPAVIIEGPQSRGVDVLKNISLRCTADGKPRPTITWHKADRTPLDFSSGRFKLLDNGTLFIQGSMSVMFEL